MGFIFAKDQSIKINTHTHTKGRWGGERVMNIFIVKYKKNNLIKKDCHSNHTVFKLRKGIGSIFAVKQMIV